MGEVSEDPWQDAEQAEDADEVQGEVPKFRIAKLVKNSLTVGYMLTTSLHN